MPPPTSWCSTARCDTNGLSAIQELGTANDFDVTATSDAAALVGQLDAAEAVVFLNSAGDLLDGEQEAALPGVVENGGGFLGIGTAATGRARHRVLRRADRRAAERRARRPARSRPSSPATACIRRRATSVSSAIAPTSGTSGRRARPAQVHTVARYHAPGAPAGDGTDIGGTDHPISWCRDYARRPLLLHRHGPHRRGLRRGRLPRPPARRDRMDGRPERANCKATIDEQLRGQEDRSGGREPARASPTSGESHGLSVAPNGWVLYIGRGDCRTDEERGALLGRRARSAASSTTPTRKWASAAAPCTSGTPRRATAPQQRHHARRHARGLRRRRPGRRAHRRGRPQDGVRPARHHGRAGLRADRPHLPPVLPELRPEQHAAGPAAESRAHLQDVRAAHLALHDRPGDQAARPLLRGRDLQVRRPDLLAAATSAAAWASTRRATSTSRPATRTRRRAPTATRATTRPRSARRARTTSRRAPTAATAAYSYQDARRTAGNTNDYNGKMLRFRPIPDLEDGGTAPPGVGAHVRPCPTRTRRTGRTCSDGTEGARRQGQARDLRHGPAQPVAPLDRSRDRHPVHGLGRPRRGRPERDPGPVDVRERGPDHARRQLRLAVLHGQRPGLPRPVVADGSLRTTNAPGYVPGGPAAGGTDGWYDCNNLHNDSPNNTGLVELPHETGTGTDAGKQRARRTSGTAAATRDGRTHERLPGVPARARRRRGARTTAPTPTQLCPYLHNDGMTVMDGPVYRYDDEAPDDSRRWPEYWDGRWFLHNNGGPSAKHAPAARPGDRPGRRAADLRRQPSRRPELGRVLHGLEVRRRTARSTSRSTRASSGRSRTPASGASTTRAARPRRARTRAAFPRRRQQRGVLERGLGRRRPTSGTSATAPTSTEANPTHQYAEAGPYTASLTVTYDGDGGTGPTRRRSRSTSSPRSTRTRRRPPRRRPRPNPNGTKPVTVSLSATDGDGLGVARTEYRINGGPWTEYTVPFRLSEPGEYTVEYRSIDQANNVEAAKELTFTISVLQNCTPDLNDEFDGTTLDPRWERAEPRRHGAVGRRRVPRPRRPGRATCSGTRPRPRTSSCRRRPTGRSWSPRASTSATWARRASRPGSSCGAARTRTRSRRSSSSTRAPSGSSSTSPRARTARTSASGRTSRQTPREAYVRVRADGDGYYIAEGSVDGENWQQISVPIENLGDPEDLKIGLKVSAGDDAESRARFLYFRVDCSDRIAPESDGVGGARAGRRRARLVLRAAARDPRGDRSRSERGLDLLPDRRRGDAAVRRAVPGHRRRRPRGRATGRRTRPRSPTSSRPTCSASASTAPRPRRRSTSPGRRVRTGRST